MEKIITDFQKNIEEIFRDRLQSTILYESVASGVVPVPRNINIVVIAESIRDEDLALYRDKALRFQKKGITNPIVMETEFFENSSCLFPLEYTEIKRRGKHREELRHGASSGKIRVESKVKGRHHVQPPHGGTFRGGELDSCREKTVQ